MTDTISITFELNTTNELAELGFETWVNDEKFVDINHVQGPQLITITISDSDGNHELRLVLKGKTGADTCINEQGTIQSDATLSISDLAFDEIKIGHMLTEHSVYTHSLNTHFQTTMEEKFHGEMGCNGTVSLKFSTPMYLWLLENM